MQRHFSNRGEALAEVTAARMLAGRKQWAKSASITQDGRPGAAEQWFSQPVEAPLRPKRKQPKRSGDVTPLL